MAHVIFIPLGSYGDVHPHLGLAAEMKRRGHAVTMITSPKFQALAEAEALRFLPLGTVEDYEANVSNPDIWHPRRALKVVLQALVMQTLRPVYEMLESEVRGRQQDTIVVASALAFGARIARDTLGVSVVTVQLQPVTLRSVHDMPRFPGADWIMRLPKSWRGGLFRFLDWAMIDPVLGPEVNKLLAELGRPPASRFFQDWWHSPDGVVGLFPEWFSPRQPDWPPQLALPGFPLYDEAGLHTLAPELEEFLAAGDPPLVFTPGSAMIRGHSFFAEAAEACRLLGRRGLLLTRYAEQIPAKLPDGVRHVSYVPLGDLLPRAAAMIYHGGIGTMAQAFRAGVPQLIMPLAHDQPDNAMRVRRLGCGDEIAPRKFKAAAVAAKLRRLLESPEVAASCAGAARHFEGIDARAAACDAIAEMGRRQKERAA